MKLTTYKDNCKHEEKYKELAMLRSLQYISGEKGIDVKYLDCREATHEENMAGTDAFVFDIRRPETEYAIDFKIRTREIEKYWKGNQDILIEKYQNGKEGWCKKNKDVYVLHVFPWIDEGSEYLPYYGAHMSIHMELMKICDYQYRTLKRAWNGFTITESYVVTISHMEKVRKDMLFEDFEETFDYLL